MKTAAKTLLFAACLIVAFASALLFLIACYTALIFSILKLIKTTTMKKLLSLIALFLIIGISAQSQSLNAKKRHNGRYRCSFVYTGVPQYDLFTFTNDKGEVVLKQWAELRKGRNKPVIKKISAAEKLLPGTYEISFGGFTDKIVIE